jgi:hypoxanthine phosphoribosyltransferase
MNDILTWFFGITTIVGTACSVYYGRKSSQLEKEQKKLDWADLQAAANDLGATIKTGFEPEVMLTPGLRGATFTNLLASEFAKEIPVFVGISSWKAKSDAISACDKFFKVETNKWFVHIPDFISNYKDKRMLLVDDFAMSGDFLEKLKDALMQHGFSKDRIKSVCIATTKVAIDNHKAPDYFWMQTKDNSFYFPWGRAR